MIRTGIIQFLIFIVVLVAVFAFYGQRTRGLVRAPSSPAPTSSISRASAGVKEGYNEASTGERANTIKKKGDEEKKPKKPGDVGKNEGTGSAKPEVLEKMRAWKRKQNAASNDCDTTITTSTTITMESEAMEGPRQMPTMYDMAMARSTTRERRDFIAGISRRKLCFHHIPKTGGTNFGFKKIFKVLFNWKELENGEMPLHIGPLLGPDVTYERMGHSGDPRGCIDGAVITILRDPKERYLSAYRNSKAIGKVCVLGSNKYEEQCACCGVKYSDLLAVGFKRDAVSVIDFLKPEIIEENQMAKMLLGEEVVSYCRDHHLDEICRSIIRHRLLSNYLLIGFSEYYEDFIEKYIDLFSLRDIPELMKKEDKQFVWESRTVVEVQPVDFQGLTKAFDELNPKEAAHVLKYTDVDRVLYDEALSLFHGKKEKTTD